MKRLFIILFFLISVINVFSAHFIENLKFENNVLSMDLKKNGLLVSVFDKNYIYVDSLVNKDSHVKFNIQKEELTGYHVVALDINNNSEFKEFGRAGVNQGSFRGPKGIFSDYFGNIYVVDSMNDRIQVFDPSHRFKFEFGNFGWSSSLQELKGQFNKPYDIVANRFIYVSDTENHRIAKFDQAGNYLTGWGGNGSDKGKFFFPKGITSDLTGDLYVVDSENNRVQKFDSNGNFIFTIGSFGRGVKQFNKPTYIAVDNNYNMFITDTRNNRVQMYDRFGGFIKYLKFGKKYVPRPQGISVLLNLVACVSTKTKELMISDIDEKKIINIPLTFVPEDVFIKDMNGKLYFYISCIRNNKIYYTGFDRDEKKL